MASADFSSDLKFESKSKASRVDLDWILVEEAGQFGHFQMRTLVLAALAICFSACASNEYVFTAARIPSRCHIPECDLDDPEFTPAWLLNAVPGTLDSFDSCQRFNATAAAPAHLDVCPAAWFDQDQVEKCERHLYGNRDTVVYDFDLGCDEWRRSLIGSAVVGGVMAAMPLTGLVSDRWGRRTAFVVNAANTAVFGLLKYFSNSYLTFTILEFVQNMLGGGSFTAVHIMMMEVAGPKFRGFAAVCGSTFFALGLIILGLIAWAVPNWRNLTLVIFTPQLLLISYFWLMDESFRWYMSKGRYEDSERILKKLAKVNKTQLSEKSLEALRQSAEEERRKETELKGQKETEPWLVVLVFRYKRVLFRCIIAPIWWVTCNLVYYGLLINAVNISGNKYINYMAVAGSQIPGFWMSLLLLDRVGRKAVLCGGFWICAACQIAYIFMPKDLYAVSLALYLIGMSCSGGVFISIYIYTAELFPTKYRHRLFAYCSMLGRIGSILAPLTPALGAAVWEKLPFALFAGCACVAGALVLLTPETSGAGFTDTMEQAEDLGKSHK